MGSLRSAADIGTPALANANSGMMTNPTQGCSIISSRSTGESVSRAATSANLSALRSSGSLLQWSAG